MIFGRGNNVNIDTHYLADILKFMTFKPKQLDPEAVTTFSGTEVGTLLENIDSKLELILEGQDGMRSDIRTMVVSGDR